MTAIPTKLFFLVLLSAGLVLVSLTARGGELPSTSRLDPTSGHNIVQMSGTIVKRGGVFVNSQASAGLPSDKCWCDDGIGSCAYSSNICTPTGGDLGCTGICRVSKK